VSATTLAPVPEHPRRLVYLGTPEMAVPPLRALVDAGFDIPLVVTRADTRRGRGSGWSPSPVKDAASALGLAVSHRVEDGLDTDADLGVVVAFGQLVRRAVLEHLPMVNIHFSLLPRWRGAAPVERALLAGDSETGTCLMQLEEGLDTGPVFDIVRVPIAERTTAAQLRALLVSAGTDQLLRGLQGGLSDPIPQHGAATYAAKITADELRIEWSRSADVLDRLVRLGGAWTTFRERRLRILSAEPTVAAGAVGSLDQLVVTSGRGGLRLLLVQPEGKAVMTAEAWANGARPRPGEVLGG